MTRCYVAVVGPRGDPGPEILALAEEVGRRLAEAGALVLTGGGSGVMAAACRGAVLAGGTTVGILPGDDRDDANPHVSIALTTGLGEMRNALLVRAVDAVIAVGGSWGTLSEVALACRTGVRSMRSRAGTCPPREVRSWSPIRRPRSPARRPLVSRRRITRRR